MKPSSDQAKNYREALINKIDCPVEQRQIATGSVNTAYLAAGTGQVVVCLHGAGAGAVTWYPAVSELAKKYRVIVPDIVGYGESDKPNAPYDRPYFSAWLKEFLEAIHISRMHLIGLSQGGAIALQFSLDHPEMVEKLVLVDSGALGAKTPFLPLLGMILMNTLPSMLANRFMSRYLLATPKKRDHNHSLYSVAVLKSIGGRNAFSQGRGAAVSPLSEKLLTQIVSPTLIIWGEDDRFFPVAYGESAAHLIPNAIFKKIQNAGHLPLIDQPQSFNKTLINFLTQ